MFAKASRALIGLTRNDTRMGPMCTRDRRGLACCRVRDDHCGTRQSWCYHFYTADEGARKAESNGIVPWSETIPELLNVH
jgi:hypothetical protein